MPDFTFDPKRYRGHTPEPWIEIADAGMIVTGIGPRKEICVFRDYGEVHHEHWIGSTEQREANKRLIAAAPRLLRTCVALQERVKRLEAAIEGLLDCSATPDPNCSCHIYPPCNDCTKWAGLREAESFARAALDDGGSK